MLQALLKAAVLQAVQELPSRAVLSMPRVMPFRSCSSKLQVAVVKVRYQLHSYRSQRRLQLRMHISAAAPSVLSVEVQASWFPLACH